MGILVGMNLTGNYLLLLNTEQTLCDWRAHGLVDLGLLRLRRSEPVCLLDPLRLRAGPCAWLALLVGLLLSLWLHLRGHLIWTIVRSRLL